MSYTGSQVLNELKIIYDSFNKKLSQINYSINKLIKDNDKLNNDNIYLLNKIGNTRLLELLNSNIKPLSEMDILSLSMITNKREDSLNSLEFKLSDAELKKEQLISKINSIDLDISKYDLQLNDLKNTVKNIVLQKKEYSALLSEKSYFIECINNYKQKSIDINNIINLNSSAFLSDIYFNYLYSKQFNLTNDTSLIYKIDLLLAKYINYFEEKNKFEFLNGLSQYLSSLLIKTEKDLIKNEEAIQSLFDDESKKLNISELEKNINYLIHSKDELLSSISTLEIEISNINSEINKYQNYEDNEFIEASQYTYQYLKNLSLTSLESLVLETSTTDDDELLSQVKTNLSLHEKNIIEINSLASDKNKIKSIINDFENLLNDFQSNSYDGYYSRFSNDVLLNFNTYNPKTIWYDIQNSYFEEKKQVNNSTYNDYDYNDNDNDNDSSSNSSNNDDGFFTSDTISNNSSFKTTDSF